MLPWSTRSGTISCWWRTFGEANRSPGRTGWLVQPIRKVNSTACDDRSHRAKGKDPTSMVGYNHLLSGHGVTPLLVASGGSSTGKSMPAQDCNHPVGGEPWRAPLTQPSPQPAWRSRAARSPWAPDRAGSLPQYFALPPVRYRPRMRNLAVPGRRRNSRSPLGRTQSRRGTS